MMLFATSVFEAAHRFFLPLRRAARPLAAVLLADRRETKHPCGKDLAMRLCASARRNLAFDAKQDIVASSLNNIRMMDVPR